MLFKVSHFFNIVKKVLIKVVCIITSEKLILRNITRSLFILLVTLACVWGTYKIWYEYNPKVAEEFNFYIFATGFIIIFVAAEIIYFIFTLAIAYNQADKREDDLRRTVYMYDVQKVLFDAYKSPENISIALNKVAEILNAEAVFLLNIEGGHINKTYISDNKNTKWSDFLSRINVNKWDIQFKDKIERGESVLYYSDNNSIKAPNEMKLLNHYEISSIMLVPVLDSYNRLAVILGGINMSKKWNNASMLECVSIDFLMAMKNMESYITICEMGTIDTLTGLKNRNCYQHALADYSLMEWESLCCVFIDANGLHEINNFLGHDTGDEMLKYIGSIIKSVFGRQDAYRIGGDEFVVFIKNMPKKKVSKNIAMLREKTGEAQCDISLGVAWLGENTNYIDKLASEAERNMYDEKCLYYKEKDNENKIRGLNQKLENMLIEKKDTDNFLSIISVYFMGVYMVDLGNDNTRVIYTPLNFSNILEENDYKFKPSVLKFINTYVHTEYREDFIEFLNYDFIDDELCKNRVPEHHYRKPDGTNVMLRIYKSKNFGNNIKETYWLFEEYR